MVPSGIRRSQVRACWRASRPPLVRPRRTARFDSSRQIFKLSICRTRQITFPNPPMRADIDTRDGAEWKSRTSDARIFLSGWTISSSRKMREPGAICEIIVGTHSLVSTPSPKPMPFGARLGIVLRFGQEFPRIHPVCIPELLQDGPKIQSCALPLS